MSAISCINGTTTGSTTQRTTYPGGADGTQAAPVQQNLAGTKASSSQTVASLSTSSVKAGTESLIASNSPISNEDQFNGMALLLCALEYLLSEDDDEKKGLLGLMLAIAQQQQQESSNNGLFMYNATSQSIESTQFQTVSVENAASAYSAGATDPAQASSDGLGAAGLDVSA